MESLQCCTLLCLDPFLKHNDFQVYSCWCLYQQSTHFVHCWVVFHSKDWGQEEKGTTEGEMVGWQHRLDGQGFGWTPGVGDGQGGLVCCSSWGGKESDALERLTWTELNCALLIGLSVDRWPGSQSSVESSCMKWLWPAVRDFST